MPAPQTSSQPQRQTTPSGKRSALLFSAAPALAVAVLAAALWPVSHAVAGIVAAAVLAALVGLLLWVALDLRMRARRSTDAVARLQKSFAAQEQALGKRDDARLLPEIQTELVRARKDLAKLQEAVKTQHRQYEALANLHALISVRAALPHTRGFAASPDALLTYVDEILRRRPELVVECGSGVSTVWAAYALEAAGTGGRVVAIEHEAEYAERTRAAIARHGLERWAEVRLAPVEEVVLNGEHRQWYALGAVEDLTGIDILFVDGPGPVALFGEHARYPAGPILGSRLKPGAFVLVDDTVRKQETEIAERWHGEWAGSTLEFLPHEAGAAVLRLP